MRRAEALLVLAVLTATPLAAREKPPAAPEDPRSAALRELLVGAPLSLRQRANKLKRFAEIKAWHRKDRERLVAEGRDKVRGRARREAREAMEAAFAAGAQDAAAVERLARQAEHLRQDWEAMRRAATGEVERLLKDLSAQVAWVHRRGFTRAGTDAAAAAFVFSDERCIPEPPAMLAYLKGLGFDEEEACILLYGLDLREQIERRMAAGAP